MLLIRHRIQVQCSECFSAAIYCHYLREFQVMFNINLFKGIEEYRLRVNREQ